MDARSEFKGVAIRVGGGSSDAPATVSGGEGADATGFRGDGPYRGHFELSGSATDWKSFVSLKGIWVSRDSVTTEPGAGPAPSSLQFPVQKLPQRCCFQYALFLASREIGRQR